MKILNKRLGTNKMNKYLTKTIAGLFIWVLFVMPVSGQHKVCIQDSVTIHTEDYRGQISWQNSPNGSDWNYISGITGDSISLIANDPFYIRLEILDGNCLPYYSDVMSVEIYDQPIVEFLSRDSACLNDRDFILSGGAPEGGKYFGPGVINGSFNPGSAGAGVHTLGYHYQDPETTCADTSYSQIEVFPLTSDSDAGPDIELITSDTVQLQANTPDYGIGTWTVISEGIGSFTDIHDPNSWFRKDSAQLDYELRWTIEGTCGTEYDDVSLNFMLLSINPCPGTPIVIDVDGNIYRTIQINNQCWMAENLRTGTYVTSTATSSDHSNLADNGVIEKYCYENDTANCTLYGGLYDWNETLGYSEEEGTQGICPDGWHIPSNQDWADLAAQYKYGDAGEHLKETGDSGFGGQFAGDRHNRGEFYSFDSSGFFWSSTPYDYRDIHDGYFRKIAACNGALEKDHFNKIIGLSVRCIKDK